MLWNIADPYILMWMTNDNRILIGAKDEYFYSPNKRGENIKHKVDSYIFFKAVFLM